MNNVEQIAELPTEAGIDTNTVLPEVPSYILRCPLFHDWCLYKDEVYFAMLNYERSEAIKRPVFDLSYCATRALNGIVLKTVVWHKEKFQPAQRLSAWRHFR